ncbi:MAG: hypothetical protein VKI83_08500 [Synechococcaceae cyanobacterium]|nr:hypothetical protein [Synechococcaceae cyanobacterium]
MNAAYSANTAGTITGLGNEAVTLSDTTLAATVLNSVNANTSGTVNAGTVTTLTGLLADVNTAYAAGSAAEISGLGNEAVTITNTAGGTLLATDLSTAGAATSGTVTVSNAQTVSGTAAEVTAALVTAATRVVMGSASSATVSDSPTAAVGAAIATTSNVTASFTTGITDSLANLASSGVATANLSSITTDQPAVVITINDAAGGTMTATDLSAVGSATTGAVTVTNAQTINGTTDQVIAAVVTAASKVTPNSSSTINASTYTTQDLSGVSSAFTLNVTTATGAVLESSKLVTADAITIGAGTASIDAASTDEVALAARITVNNATTLTVNNYVNTDLSGLSNQGTGSIVVNTTTGADLDESRLADATSVVLGAAATGAAAAIDGLGTNGSRINLNNQTLSVSGYTTEDLSGISSTGTLNVTTASGAVLDAAKLVYADAITIGAGSASGTATDLNTLGEEKITIATGTTLNVSAYTNQELAGFIKQGSAILNVTTATGAALTSANLADATTITIGAGSATIDVASTDEVALAAKTTVNNGTTLTVNNYINTDLSGLSNQGSGSIVVNTTTSAVLDEAKLADATSVVLGAAATGVASAIDGIGTNGSRINLNGQTLSVSGYTTEDLSGISSSGSLNVTTVNGAVLDAAKLAYADAITVVGTNTATAADADTLGSRLSGTATLNITTDPITANTDLSDLGSGLTLQFGGDTSVAVNGATLTVRQDQVSGYTISGTGTLAAAGTASADSFNASGISATLNITSLAGNDGITVAPTDLGSADSIDGGNNTDTLSFSAAASGVVDGSFTNVTSVEILQLASGTNSVTLGAEAEQAGITTVTGSTGADTINLLYGTTGLTFNAGAGSDTLSYSADSTAQAITLTSISSGSASGSVSNGGSDSFTALEGIVGGSGSSDAITSTASGETLILTGANSGTLDGFAFSGVESVDLVGGNDTATINSGGSLSGNLSFGTGTDTLNYGSYGSAVAVTLSSISSGSGTTSSGGATGIAGVVSGVESITGSAASDTLSDGTGASTLAITGANSGTLDSLSFSGFENLSLSTGIDTVTVSSGASLTGDLNLGDGTSNSLSLSAGAGAIGSVTASSGDDTVTISGGSVSGAVNLGDGTNALTISPSTSSIGSYTGGTGSDTLTLSGGDVSGNVDLGSGSNTLKISSTSSSIGGTVSLGSGTTDTLTYAGYASSVSVTLNGSNSTDSGGATGISGAISGLDSLVGSGNSDALTSSSADNTLVLSGANSGALDSALSFSAFESVDLGSGNDAAQFTSGDSLSGTLAGGSGSDTLDYSGYGSAVTVNLATGSATGTGGISGFETVLGSSAADTITASTSGDVNLQGNGGNDTFNVTIAGLTSTDSIDGGNGSDQLVFTDAGTISDSQFTNVTLVESVTLTGATSLTAGTEASQAGIATVVSGTGNTTVNTTLAGYDLTVDAASLADSASLTLSGSASSNDFTVNSLIGTVLAAGTSGSLSITTGDAADNAIGVTTGSGATTITAGSSSDSLSVNADALLDNTTLAINGSATYSVTNLEGNLDASGASGSLSVTYSNVTDNGATFTSGSGNVTVSGGDATDTVTVTGLSTNGQTFNAQASTSNFNITAGANTQTITGSNTGSDTVDGGSGTDTLSYAGGSAVTVTLSGYSTLSGGSTGQGTDSFSNIESLVGSSGTDTLKGRNTATDETVTITGANSGTISDSPSTGTFSFSSFEQLDLQGGNDTLTITGNGSGVSLASSVDLGSGNNTLTMSGSAGSIASLAAGSGNDSFSLSAGSITGALSAGDGSNTLTISGSSSSVGSYTGGTGSDAITLSGGDVGGNVDLGSGSNSLTINSLSSSIGGNVSFGAGTADTLSYAGYSSAVSVNLSDITSNAGSTAAGGATAISGTVSGFEILVGGSNSADSLTDSSGDSTVAITGADSGTIDGLAFSAIENLNLSTGNDTVTVTGSGGGVSLTGSLDLGDGTNSLSMSGSAGSIASVSSGSGDDTMTISAGSVTGAVNAGDGSNNVTISGTSSTIGSFSSGSGTDSLTLSGGDVVGAVSTGGANDTLLISSTASSIGGTVDLGGGSGDTLSYAGYSNAVSVTLTDITSNTGSTAAAGATAISGTATGFEILVGGSNTADSVTDSTGDSTIVISGANSGTIDGLAFSAIENLTLSSGIDAVTVQSGGSLSGTLDLGEGTSNTVQMNSGAGSIGVLSAGSGNDTVTIDGGSVTGAVSLGDGTNTLTINNTASSIGSYSGGSGIDSIVSKGGDVNGAISTGSAADSVTLSLGSIVSGNVTLGADSDLNDAADLLSLDASSITGNVSTGSGIDAVSVLNSSTITGNVTLGANTDTADGGDTLTVTGASSSNKSVITGSIATGAAADVVVFSDATIGGSGATLSLGTDSNSLDGGDSLTASNTAITATVTTGSGSDSLSLSSGTAVSGNVTLGVDGDGYDGNDSLTLTGASSIDGSVALGGADDTLNLSTGITSPTTIKGTVSFESGLADTLSYAGNAGPITVAINSDSGGTATSAYASYITGDVSGFEYIIGSDASAATSGSTVGSAVAGDTIYDNTSNSLVILTGANQGTIEEIDFSSIENLQLRAGSDTLSFRGSAGFPGLIAGLADGGGIEGASYSNGVYSGGSYSDTSVDLLDYTQYQAGGVTVDLSQNMATGVFAGAAGGLVSGDGKIETSTQDSSFENVDGSGFDDAITGDNQTAQGNVLRGFGGGDTILGLAGADTIDGGDGTSGPDGDDLIAAGDGADLIRGSDGNDFISGGGYAQEGSYMAVSDTSVDTLTYIDENEGLDISLDGTDAGTVNADAAATLSISTFTNTYDPSGAQTISAPTNQLSTDWTDTYGDIQRLVLTNQNDILRLDTSDFISSSSPTGPSSGTFSVDAGGGSLDTLDYSTFDISTPVIVNLSGSSFTFDFDSNNIIDTTVGEISIQSVYSATNINAASVTSGSYGVNNFEVVIGGAADDAIVGNNDANILVGNDGADRIAGLDGADSIYGGKGDDFVIPGEGADYVNGGQGINTIQITSSDLAQDVFAVDPNGINIFKLNGDGSGTNSTTIVAPSGAWNPGAQGIDLIDGGDPVSGPSGPVYDTILGTNNNDYYQFGGTALKNVSNIDMGLGDDTVGTAPTSKGIKVSYEGGGGTDGVTLNLTFRQFANLNLSGAYVRDVSNYIEDPTGKTFSSDQADFSTSGFETGAVSVVIPAVFNSLQADPAAVTFNSSVGLQGVSSTTGDDLTLAARGEASSSATAASVEDLVSAFVQANNVKGSDAVSLSSGGETSGSSTATQTARASAITVNDRSDTVLSAYALGVDRSAITAGGDVNLTLSGNVNADAVAEAVNSVVNSSGTAEAAGSRDSSLVAGEALNATIRGSLAQKVAATVTDGLAIAGLASRSYGLDDANLTDTSSDSVQAGSDLSLTVSAGSSSQVTARGIDSQSLGPITLVNNGVASTDRFTLPSTLWGAAFPLINGDRISFATAPAGGSLEAFRDYFVLNVIPITGEFQLSSTPAGDPLDVVVADNNTVLQAFRPAVSTADAISIVTAVDLNRNASGQSGLQAGDSLNLTASASDEVRSTATNVAGEATAGLNRLGSLDGLDTQLVSRVLGLSDTVSSAGESAALQLSAQDSVVLQATSTSGDALSEGNAQVLASSLSPTTAGADLTIQATAALNVDARATSTSGSAESRSAAGAGAGSSTSPASTGANLGHVVPRSDTYGVASGLVDGSQRAGDALTLNASANLNLSASSSTTGGTTTLGSLWSNASNTLSTFNPAASTPSLIGPQLLAEGQRVQVDAANATALGLSADQDYVVRLIGSKAVNTSTDRITVPADISYANGDAIRFRLNSDIALNSNPTRYGLELGTTYYVVGYTANAAGNNFQLATAPGGPAIDLTADLSGAADQLVDSDRFQLLLPPTAPGLPYTVAPLTANQSGRTLLLPAESNAFAGSRQASITPSANGSLDLAEVNGIDGGVLAAGGGVLSLLSGGSSSVNALAGGVVNALARNVDGDATASGGLVATGLEQASVLAGSEGTVTARAAINAVADAATTGDSDALDGSLSSLNLTARGLNAVKADQDISLGADGQVTAEASVAARSSASVVKGDADAMAVLDVGGLRAAETGVQVTIADVGDLSASARLGSAAAPVLISALSSGVGEASARGASQVEGILGTPTGASFSAIQAGAAQGDIRSQASADIRLQATATDGSATASLADVSGAGPAVVSGIRDMALSAGAGSSRIDASAAGQYAVAAQSVSDDASAMANTSAAGILSDTTTALPVSFSQNGAIASLANDVTISRAISVAGDAGSDLRSASLGLGNVALTIGGNGEVDVSATSAASSLSQSVAGHASA